MRIGEFARKYDMNVTTIRYYIENALLTPQRKNNQYIFDRSCMEDMDKILEYKECGLSLEEIELLFFLEKTSRFQDEAVLGIVRELFERKITSFREEVVQIQSSINHLEKQLQQFAELRIRESQNQGEGVPFSFIPILYCPRCGVPLSMDHVRIDNGQICEGKLSCTCGYHADLLNGMIICDSAEEDTPFKLFNNVDSVYSATDEYSGVYRVLLDKVNLYMYQNMPATEYPQYVMFGPFTANYLLRFCDNLDKKHIYIVIDPSINRIRRLREYLSDSGLQIVYMAGRIDDIPLREKSIDIYMDDYSVTNSLFTYGQFIYDKVNPLLKENGIIIGAVGDYANAPISARNIRKDHPDYPIEKLPPSKFRANMKMNGFEVREMKTVGSTHGNEMHFPRNEVGEQVTMMGYVAVKNKT